MDNEYIVALAGNPNVGKSTIFNSFTGLHQHTGNWTGKTVDNARGEYTYSGERYIMLDLPGTYSLNPASAEEAAACAFIGSGYYDVLVVVIDAVCIERNLRFAAELLSKTERSAVICLNLMDEAKKKGVEIDLDKMREMLGVPVVPAAARNGEGLEALKEEIRTAVHNKEEKEHRCPNPEEIYKACCKTDKRLFDLTDRRIDRFVLSKSFGIPFMLLLLLAVFWITIEGANYPSQLLSSAFAKAGSLLRSFLAGVHCPEMIISLLIDGVYTTLTWVVAVMLPPMAIFFPLFTLMEDSGLLPRIAFNLDSSFRRSGAHGKQALTTAMGFGCNACAVTGCRIIDSPRERLIAVITNSLIPCNGRFPMIISLITIFLCSSGAASSAVLLLFVAAAVIVSLLLSKLLSVTLLRGKTSSFVLELPPYRRPQIGKVLVRSLLDRTVFVLMRAVAVAAPAGLVIWILANVSVGGVSLIEKFTQLLDPFASLVGLDGTILAAFILGFPANEIVIPIALMIYMSDSVLTQLPELSALADILTTRGWTSVTAVCVIVFSMFHFPCSTTCLTIYKETKSLKWTAVSIVLPLITGLLLCACISGFCRL